MSLHVGLITCVNLPEPDPDQTPLLAALRDSNVEAEMVAWDDPNTDLARFDLCVIRSTWNYYKDCARFMDWLAHASKTTHLLNRAPIIEWNLHKFYLDELQRAGVPIVPTAFISKSQHAELSAILAPHDWQDIVIKPAISASSFDTKRFTRAQLPDAQAFLDYLLVNRDALVQQYMPTVETSGERALICIAGEFTHAIRKNPRFSRDDESVSDALSLEPDERAFADSVLDAIPERVISATSRDELLYARIDIMRNQSGAIRLSELELIEPSLFLIQSPPAMARIVSAIKARASS